MYQKTLCHAKPKHPIIQHFLQSSTCGLYSSFILIYIFIKNCNDKAVAPSLHPLLHFANDPLEYLKTVQTAKSIAEQSEYQRQ